MCFTLYLRVYHPGSGRVLKVFSSQPGIHIYTPNFTCGSLIGKHGEAYSGRSAFCIENQNFPNSINQVPHHYLMLNKFLNCSCDCSTITTVYFGYSLGHGRVQKLEGHVEEESFFFFFHKLQLAAEVQTHVFQEKHE